MGSLTAYSRVYSGIALNAAIRVGKTEITRFDSKTGKPKVKETLSFSASLVLDDARAVVVDNLDSFIDRKDARDSFQEWAEREFLDRLQSFLESFGIPWEEEEDPDSLRNLTVWRSPGYYCDWREGNHLIPVLIGVPVMLAKDDGYLDSKHPRVVNVDIRQAMTCQDTFLEQADRFLSLLGLENRDAKRSSVRLVLESSLSG
jgi:hypothetical protein